MGYPDMAESRVKRKRDNVPMVRETAKGRSITHVRLCGLVNSPGLLDASKPACTTRRHVPAPVPLRTDLQWCVTSSVCGKTHG